VCVVCGVAVSVCVDVSLGRPPIDLCVSLCVGSRRSKESICVSLSAFTHLPIISALSASPCAKSPEKCVLQYRVACCSSVLQQRVAVCVNVICVVSIPRAESPVFSQNKTLTFGQKRALWTLNPVSCSKTPVFSQKSPAFGQKRALWTVNPVSCPRSPVFGQRCLHLLVQRALKCVCCIVLQQCAAVCCSVLQQCAAVCCSVLQCVAVCCSVLQCVAVCFSVLQCASVCSCAFQCTDRRLLLLVQKALQRVCCSSVTHERVMNSTYNWVMNHEYTNVEHENGARTLHITGSRTVHMTETQITNLTYKNVGHENEARTLHMTESRTLRMTWSGALRDKSFLQSLYDISPLWTPCMTWFSKTALQFYAHACVTNSTYEPLFESRTLYRNES